MCKSHSLHKEQMERTVTDETLLYDMGLPTGRKCKMSSAKHVHTACKVPKLSEELLLQENNELDCEAEHSNVNAIDEYQNIPRVCYLAKARGTGCTPANRVLGW